jgi:hypothetical protein
MRNRRQQVHGSQDESKTNMLYYTSTGVEGHHFLTTQWCVLDKSCIKLYSSAVNLSPPPQLQTTSSYTTNNNKLPILPTNQPTNQTFSQLCSSSPSSLSSPLLSAPPSPPMSAVQQPATATTAQPSAASAFKKATAAILEEYARTSSR